MVRFACGYFIYYPDTLNLFIVIVNVEMCSLLFIVILCLSVLILDSSALNCRIRYGPGKESKWMKIYHTCLKMLDKAQISVQARSDIMSRSVIKPITPATVNKYNVGTNIKSAGDNMLGRVPHRTTTESEYFYTLDDGTEYEDETTEKENVEQVYKRNCALGKDCGKDRDEYSKEPVRPSRTNRQRRRSRLEFHFSRRNQYKPNVKRNPNNNDDQIWQYSQERIGLKDNACALHCFIDALKMTDDTGFPNKHLVRQVVTRDIGDQELKDFLQQSADDCFQILKANKVNKCEYSKNLLICLTDKGKANCDDLKSDEPGMVAGVPKAYQYTYIKHLRP